MELLSLLTAGLAEPLDWPEPASAGTAGTAGTAGPPFESVLAGFLAPVESVKPVELAAPAVSGLSLQTGFESFHKPRFKDETGHRLAVLMPEPAIPVSTVAPAAFVVSTAPAMPAPPPLTGTASTNVLPMLMPAAHGSTLSEGPLAPLAMPIGGVHGEVRESATIRVFADSLPAPIRIPGPTEIRTASSSAPPAPTPKPETGGRESGPQALAPAAVQPAAVAVAASTVLREVNAPAHSSPASHRTPVSVPAPTPVEVLTVEKRVSSAPGEIVPLTSGERAPILRVPQGGGRETGSDLRDDPGQKPGASDMGMTSVGFDAMVLEAEGVPAMTMAATPADDAETQAAQLAMDPPETPASPVARRVEIELGEADSRVRVTLHERGGDVSVRFQSASEAMTADLQASAGSLIEALKQEKVPLANLDFISSFGSGDDRESRSRNWDPVKTSVRQRKPGGSNPSGDTVELSHTGIAGCVL